MSWLHGLGSWPRQAGNAPNTLLPPVAKGREAAQRGHFIVIASSTLCCGGWEVMEKEILVRGSEPRKHPYLSGLIKIP